jgi:Domain of unknown function (DUF3883)
MQESSSVSLLSARDQIVEKAQSVVEIYAAARRASRGRSNPYSSLTVLLQQMQREYEDRFLYELIQNAYDAHPPEADGQIALLLDELEGEHGVLYVANGGEPFDPDNFEAICELAQSNKAPDQSIGNKGVGFKSVLQVCAWPEIYSRVGSEAATFDGFCFGFAGPNHYEALCNGDQELADALRRDVAPYFLPVPIDELPAAVERFADQNFATVIRLPLDSPTARAVATDRLERLASETVPLQLFLPRLRRLKIARHSAEEHSVVTLGREAMAINDPRHDPDQRYEFVQLGDQGEWFVSHRRVRAEEMSEAIEVSIEAKDLDPAWREWSEDAWVAVAVRRDGHPVQPRLYTYLPMEGETEAPFHGHLHAPFSTKLARNAVSESVALNARLLDYAARAATAAVVTFAADEGVLPPTALVDLLAWDEHHHDRVTESFTETGVDMKSAQVVPIHRLPDGRTRGGFDVTFTWLYETDLLRPELVARDAAVELVDTAIAGDRLARLERYCRAFFGGGFVPSAKSRAEWVASAAATMLERKAGFRTWDRFYGDIAVLFADNPDALRGHRVLLGDDNELHAPPADSQDLDQPLVFFPPVRERSDDDEAVEGDFDLAPPALLRRRLVLLNENLRWNRQDGRIRRATPARRFLQDNRLVRRFDTIDLLEHTERALASSSSTTLAREALSFAFRLFASARSIREDELRRVNLRVPCGGRWIAASEAFFSTKWKTELAGELAEVVERAGPVSNELADVASRLVDPPGQRPFSVTNIERWRKFLTAIGVRDGLWPQPVRRPTDSCQGRELGNPEPLIARFGLSGEDATRWVAAVEGEPRETARYPYTPYRPTRPVTILPGQRDYVSFDDRTRSVWARLVVAGLERWGHADLEVIWSRYLARHRSDRNAISWPSPIQAFLAETEWLPITEPGERREEGFVRPREAWFYSETVGDRPPQFSPLVSTRIRRALSDSGVALQAIKGLGLGDWLDPEQCPQLLRHLASLLEQGSLPESGQWAFRNSLLEVWSRATAWDPGEFAEAMADTPLVVTRDGVTETVLPADLDSEDLYVVPTGRSFAARVLDAGGLPLLTVNEADAQAVTSLLDGLVRGQVRTADSLDVEFVVDGHHFEPSAAAAKLVDSPYDWLPKLLQLVLEVKRSRFDTSSAKRRSEVIDKLNRIRLYHANEVLIKAGELTVTPSGPNREVLPIDDPSNPTLILRAQDGNESLAELVEVVPGLCELLGITPYEDAIGRSIEKLIAMGVETPTPLDFAQALHIDPARVGEVLSHLGAPMDALVTMIAPAIACLADHTAALALLEKRGAIDDDAALADLLEELLAGATTVGADQVIAEARVAGALDDLRRGLGIDFAQFNAALRELGGEYAPIRNEAAHAQALRHYAEVHREELLLGLRRRFLRAFHDDRSLEDYATSRELQALRPDPAWLDDHDIPPDELIAKHAARWIESLGEPPLAGDDSLLPLSTLRPANREVVASTTTLAARCVLGWARKNGVTASDLWRDGPVGHMLNQVLQSGRLDFEPLDEGAVIELLVRSGHWPEGMPPSLDLSDLGLSATDLQEEEDAEARERRERLEQRRRISVDGQSFSAEHDGYGALATHVRSSVRPDLLTSARRVARLGLMSETSPTSRERIPGARGGVVRAPSLSDHQTKAIGLVGETVAYEWLRHRYPEACTPSSWRSSYCETIGQPAGDDTLGYDFEIALKTVTIFFEVKATSGTDTIFELGESEVGKARDCTRSDRFDYRIVFITEVLDADTRQLFLLPNPMDPTNRDRFRFPGSGLTCAFRLDG